MGCNCGGKKSHVKYRANFTNGSPPQTYNSVAEAQAALKAAGGGTFTAVAA